MSERDGGTQRPPIIYDKFIDAFSEPSTPKALELPDTRDEFLAQFSTNPAWRERVLAEAPDRFYAHLEAMGAEDQLQRLFVECIDALSPGEAARFCARNERCTKQFEQAAAVSSRVKAKLDEMFFQAYPFDLHAVGGSDLVHRADLSGKFSASTVAAIFLRQDHIGHEVLLHDEAYGPLLKEALILDQDGPGLVSSWAKLKGYKTTGDTLLLAVMKDDKGVQKHVEKQLATLDLRGLLTASQNLPLVVVRALENKKLQGAVAAKIAVLEADDLKKTAERLKRRGWLEFPVLEQALAEPVLKAKGAEAFTLWACVAGSVPLSSVTPHLGKQLLKLSGLECIDQWKQLDSKLAMALGQSKKACDHLLKQARGLSPDQIRTALAHLPARVAKTLTDHLLGAAESDQDLQALAARLQGEAFITPFVNNDDFRTAVKGSGATLKLLYAAILATTSEKTLPTDTAEAIRLLDPAHFEAFQKQNEVFVAHWARISNRIYGKASESESCKNTLIKAALRSLEKQGLPESNFSFPEKETVQRARKAWLDGIRTGLKSLIAEQPLAQRLLKASDIEDE